MTDSEGKSYLSCSSCGSLKPTSRSRSLNTLLGSLRSAAPAVRSKVEPCEKEMFAPAVRSKAEPWKKKHFSPAVCSKYKPRRRKRLGMLILQGASEFLQEQCVQHSCVRRADSPYRRAKRLCTHTVIHQGSLSERQVCTKVTVNLESTFNETLYCLYILPIFILFLLKKRAVCNGKRNPCTEPYSWHGHRRLGTREQCIITLATRCGLT